MVHAARMSSLSTPLWLGLAALDLEVEFQVVLKVLANARAVLHHRDAERPQLLLRPDA